MEFLEPTAKAQCIFNRQLFPASQHFQNTVRSRRKAPPLNQRLNPGVMAHAFDPRAQQAEASLLYRVRFRTARDYIMRSCLRSLKMFYANFTTSLNSNCEEVLITQGNSCNFFDPQSS